MSIVLCLCGTIGCLISLYFTLVYYKFINADQWFLPRVCKMDEGMCQMIIHTRDAGMFGIPNFVLGLVYYLAIIFYANVSFLQQTMYINNFLLFVSRGTVILGVYLSYSLLFKVKTLCVLCFSCHILNLILMILLLSK